jgi:hypothetical protein
MARSENLDCTARPGEAVRLFRNEEGSCAIGVGRVIIASVDPLFVHDVVKDLSQLVHRPEGDAALRDGDAIGRPVRIVKADPPTEPPSAWVVPDDLAAAGNGTGCGSAMFYDPTDWPRLGDPRSPSSVEILLMLVRQANVYAAGNANPAQQGRGAKNPRAER